MAKKTAKPEIKILCTYTELIPIEDLEDFQGKLKGITRESMEKLKAALREGIKFPKNVWRHGGKNYIINGHQTKKALLELRDEGYKLPPGVPCVFVKAKDRLEAKRALLQADSKYSRVTRQGYQAFTSGMDVSGLGKTIEIPEMRLSIEGQDEERPEIEFTEELLEEHNYVVLYFDNKVDWLQAISLLGIEAKKSLDSKKGFEHCGVGRVVRGADAIRKIQDGERVE
jgi:hypothetical protein